MPTSMTKSHTPYHIRNWPVWLGLACGWLLAQAPYRLQMTTGSLLGRLAYRLAGRRRHIAETNIRLCFPELSASEQQQLVKANFISLGRGIVETAMSWWTPDNKLSRLAHVAGLEHLDAALTHGKGVILLSAHFVNLEIGGRLLALHRPFHVLYREHKNAAFETVMRRAREHHFEKAISRDDMRGMIRSLKQNMPVWYAPDQNYGRENSVFVTFFGQTAATITATSRLARMTGARVVPFFQHRLNNGEGYQLELLPALEDFPGDDEAVDCQRINDLIETVVRRYPEQYLWVHRRFKTQPEGAASVY
jgi:KDO2-lipid IV(A) lauroyltransferase